MTVTLTEPPDVRASLLPGEVWLIGAPGRDESEPLRSFYRELLRKMNDAEAALMRAPEA